MIKVRKKIAFLLLVILSGKIEQDIRWEQRSSNYEKALRKLNEAVVRIESFSSEEKKISSDKILYETIKDGLTHRFKCTFNPACSLMIDYAKFQGNSEISGNRDAISNLTNLN